MKTMITINSFCIIASSLLFTISSCQFGPYEVHYEWKQIDFNFPNESVRNELVQNGGFVQLNVVPTGVKIFKNSAFIMTPRYLPGVPSTLNVISYKKSHFDQIFHRRTGPKLTPFPSYEMQEIGNCVALQTVQAVELDPYNRLWIVDVGRVDVLEPMSRNLCSPKLVILDLNNKNQIERVYEFPDSVAPKAGNVLKDIQVECTSREDCISYISDLNMTCSIVVYDYKRNDSWRATHPKMQPELDKGNITIDGTTAAAGFGLTGLGLTPSSTNYSTLYFSKIAGDRIYRVSTATLKNSKKLKSNPVLEDKDIQDLGQKSMGQADGTAMDNRGRWFFGSLPETAVYSVDTTGNPTPLPKPTRVVANTRDLQWVDTFSFDGNGFLTFMTNRFQLFANGKINASEINFRLNRFRTDSTSYQTRK